MKKVLSLVSAVLLLTSCEIFDNRGYPFKVNFGSQGGTQKVFGDEGIYTLEIADYNANGTSAQRDTITDSLIVTYEWLTAKAKMIDFDRSITLIAEPNKTGKKRRFYVRGMVDNYSIDIKVTQSP